MQKQLAQIPTEGVPALPRLGHCESVADDRLAISVIRGDDSENSSYTIHRCGKNERINEIEIKGLEVVLLGPSSNRSTETGKHPSYMDMLLEGHDEHGFQVVSGRKKRQRQKRSNSSRSLDTRDDRQGYSVAMLRRGFEPPSVLLRLLVGTCKALIVYAHITRLLDSLRSTA